MKTILHSLAFLILAALILPVSSHAQDADENVIKDRMLKRVSAIDGIKISGKAGENNVGLLEQKGPLSPAETKLMNEENADRRSLYTLLAKRLGLTMTVVGQGRAEGLRKNSATGVWLQDRGGNWYKKQ